MKPIDNKSEYALSTLMFVVRLAAEGDFRTPLKLGLSEQQIHQLLALNNQEIHDMATLAKANFMTIQFDQEALNVALHINAVKSLRRKEIVQMLNAGASYPVMHHLYGLTTENMANFKKMMNLPKNEGRPLNATETEEHELWELMKPAGGLDSEDLAKLLLNAHQKTQVKISTIWVLLKEWWGDEQTKSLQSA